MRWIAPLVVVAAVTATIAGTHMARSGTATGGTAVLAEKMTGAGSSSSNGKSTPPAKAFTIAGTVSGLYPGVTSKLYLSIDNPNNQAIEVTKITVTLLSIDKAEGAPAGACLVSDAPLNIQPWTASSLTVAKNSLASTAPNSWVPVTLKSSAPNACQGAQFNLSYYGEAVQG